MSCLYGATHSERSKYLRTMRNGWFAIIFGVSYVARDMIAYRVCAGKTPGCVASLRKQRHFCAWTTWACCPRGQRIGRGKIAWTVWTRQRISGTVLIIVRNSSFIFLYPYLGVRYARSYSLSAILLLVHWISTHGHTLVVTFALLWNQFCFG